MMKSFKFKGMKLMKISELMKKQQVKTWSNSYTCVEEQISLYGEEPITTISS